MASEESAVPVDASSAAADAKAKREARKARILGAGNDRLARITKTGRGGEAEALYSNPPKPLGGGINTSIDDDEVLQRANAALRGGTGDADDDPQDIDISQQQSAQTNPFLAMMQQQQAGAGGQADQAGMPQDLQGMMRAMQEAMMNASQGQPGQPGQGPGGAGPQSPFPFGPGAATAQQVPAGPSTTDAIFNLLRVFIFAIFGIALVYGALFGRHADAKQTVTEHATEQILDKFAHMSSLHRWARLAYERPAQWEAKYFSMESFGLPIPEGVPVFWLFITLEIGLQSMRIMLQRRRPAPPGFLLKVASFIPNANIQLLIRTLASYLPLLDAFINDIAVVVFTIGCAILFASWKVGLDPILAPSDATMPQGILASGIQNIADAANAVISETVHAAPDIINPAGPPM